MAYRFCPGTSSEIYRMSVHGSRTVSDQGTCHAGLSEGMLHSAPGGHRYGHHGLSMVNVPCAVSSPMLLGEPPVLSRLSDMSYLLEVWMLKEELMHKNSADQRQ